MEQLTQWSSELITAAVTAAVFALWKLIETRVAKGKQRKARTVPRAIEANHAIYAALNGLANSSRAARVAILRATNGGKLAKAGQDLYASLAFEVVDASTTPAREGWQSQRLDEPYIALLRDVYHDANGVWTRTAKAKPGILRTFAEATGIGSTYLMRVAGTQGTFFYLMLNFKDSAAERGDAIFSEAVRVAVSQVSRALREDYDSFDGFDAD